MTETVEQRVVLSNLDGQLEFHRHEPNAQLNRPIVDASKLSIQSVISKKLKKAYL